MKDNIEHGWILSNHQYNREKKHICDWCGEEIYEGDEYYEFNKDKVCCSCVKSCKKTT